MENWMWIMPAIVALFGIVSGLIWKLSVAHHKLDDLEPLRKNASKIVDMTNQFPNLVRQVDEMHAKLFGHALAKEESPISLTDYGAKIANEIDADDLVTRYVDELAATLKHKNAYEIQQACFNFAKEELLNRLEKDDKAHFDKISLVAFNEGLDIKEILEKATGIKLRDRILAMTETSHQDADEHSLATQTQTL